MQKLEAVNKMLVAIGLTSVSSIDGNQHPAVVDAVVVLDGVDNKIQARGWYFNTDYNLTLAHNEGTGEVIVPATTLAVNPTDTFSSLVQRGTKLYDRKNATFVIGESVEVTLIQLLDFTYLPENAAEYISDRATRDFIRDKTGDQQKIKTIEADIVSSFARLNSENIKHNNVKIADNPTVVNVMSGIYPAW